MNVRKFAFKGLTTRGSNQHFSNKKSLTSNGMTLLGLKFLSEI